MKIQDLGFVILLVVGFITMKITDYQIEDLNKRLYQLEKRVVVLEYKMRKCK